MGQSRLWSAEQVNENQKRKSGSRAPICFPGGGGTRGAGGTIEESLAVGRHSTRKSTMARSIGQVVVVVVVYLTLTDPLRI